MAYLTSTKVATLKAQNKQTLPTQGFATLLSELQSMEQGIGLRVASAEITHDGGATQSIVTLPANSLVLDALFVVTEAFDGSPTINIGVSGGDTDGFIADGKITKTLGAVAGIEADDYGDLLWDTGNTHRRNWYTSGSAAVIASVASGSSAGAGNATIIYAELPSV